MTERERLIELIRFGYGKGRANENVKQIEETIADYLLANGVTVPPCKVDDTIYIVDENSNEFTGIDECHVRSLEWNGTFWSIFNDKDCYGYSEDYIGKTIFLVKEEAEQALKERQTNGKVY